MRIEQLAVLIVGYVVMACFTAAWARARQWSFVFLNKKIDGGLLGATVAVWPLSWAIAITWRIGRSFYRFGLWAAGVRYPRARVVPPEEKQ